MSARTLSILVLGAALTAGLAACGSDARPAAPVQSAPSSPIPSSSPISSSPAPSAPVQSAPVQSPPVETEPVSKQAGRPAEGCPVDETTLLTVMGREDDPKSQLRGIVCHRDYAIAGLYTPGFTGEVATFRHGDGAWHHFTAGSGRLCEGLPADVAKRFRSRWSGCRA
ncbi:hypothetical protein AB0M20_29685 [Actinoplanes sp. NPDC051633]|uniref:hypothetical protein n=1 Tax=Actinoplanes sp. NPDC051633 TaxID=3155670 RepID=UPI0034310EE0